MRTSNFGIKNTKFEVLHVIDETPSNMVQFFARETPPVHHENTYPIGLTTRFIPTLR